MGKSSFCKQINQLIGNYLLSSKEIINSFDKPENNSQASIELTDRTFSKYVASAITLSVLFREISIDNLMGIQELIVEPMTTSAPFVLFRALVESCSFSFWFISTKLTPKLRTERVFLYRYNSLNEEIKYLCSSKFPNQVINIQNEMDKMVNQAKDLNLSIVSTKNNSRKLISIPKKTEIISETLDAEEIYRLFSGIVHGQHWAILQSSFRRVDSNLFIYPGIKGGTIEKNIEPKNIMSICHSSIKYLLALEKERFSFFRIDTSPLLQLQIDFNRQISDISNEFHIPFPN